MLARMEKQGDGVVIHALRGKASNRRISEETQKQVSKETVRGWMIEGGLWKSHSRKLKEAHPWRPRRSGYGELTQWDTSDQAMEYLKQPDWYDFGPTFACEQLAKRHDIQKTDRSRREAAIPPELADDIETWRKFSADASPRGSP